MVIHKLHLCTRIPIWNPKYSGDSAAGNWEVWISQSKVNFASPVVIIEFTKAKHLIGGRFCIRKQDIQRSPVGTNGKIPVYKVPFDKLESYETASELRDLALNIWED